MKNGDHAIGLFQGMFEKNILTFNPVGTKMLSLSRIHGRSRAAAPVEERRCAADDTRRMKRSTGPASFMIAAIRMETQFSFDQHV